MQNLIKFGLIPAAGLALPLAASAGAPTGDQDISYDYLEASWVFADELEIDPDFAGSESTDVNGFALKGSAEIAPNIFVRGSGLSLDVDEAFGPGDDGTIDTQSLGAGYAFPLMTGPSPLDVWVGASYERLDAFGEDLDGYGADAGVRWMPIQGFELNAFGGYRDYGSAFDTEIDGWAYGVGAQYHVTQNLALTGDWLRYDLEADSDFGDVDLTLDAFMVGGRWYY